MYKLFVKPLLFLLAPEKAHHFTFTLLKFLFFIPGMKQLVRSCYCIMDDRLKRNVFGIDFPNPVGVAAGFDKNGEYVKEFSAFGFGFVEIGTVTPVAQEGNPKPRMFRLVKDKALINRMGFNNDGAGQIANRLKKYRGEYIIGGNIGKNKTTPNEDAISDYIKCFDALYDAVDYFVVNVSSPNTPGLRSLQEKEPLQNLLTAIMKRNRSKPKQKPVLLKIAPDLTFSQIDEILGIVIQTNLSGIVATNTTVERNNLQTPNHKLQAIGLGGLSGKPLSKRSTEIIRYIHDKSGGTIPIIGAGGIHSPEDALEKLNAGASLVQIYTGFIYEGPSLLRQISSALINA